MATKRRRFAQRRKVMGYTQEQFAEKLGVDRTTVARWEAGATAPHPWQRRRIADALKMSVDEIAALLDTIGEECRGKEPHARYEAGGDESDRVKRRDVLDLAGGSLIALAVDARMSALAEVVAALTAYGHRRPGTHPESSAHVLAASLWSLPTEAWLRRSAAMSPL